MYIKAINNRQDINNNMEKYNVYNTKNYNDTKTYNNYGEALSHVLKNPRIFYMEIVA